MSEPLDLETVDTRLRDGPWQRRAERIVRSYELKDFASAIAFVDRVAELAERAGHHPDISVHGYRHVTLELTTHSAGGITEADLELAGEIDRLDPT